MLGYNDAEAESLKTGAIIGKGATSVVRLLRSPHEHLVIKSFFKTCNPHDIRREIVIHKHLSKLKHKNIIQQTSAFHLDGTWHIVMEKAEGGELFEQIEPDIGFSESVAQLYFRQLWSAVNEMHQEGIAHRDIKPENILLNKEGVLKLADFGMATVYKNDQNKQRRRLTSRAGTRLYAAPEILKGDDYDGEMADVWSMGVVLYLMLVGDAPWSEASDEATEFKKYKDKAAFNDLNCSSEAQTLLLSMLKVDPKARASLVDIKDSEWFVTEIPAASLSHPGQSNPLHVLDDSNCFSQPSTLLTQSIGTRFYIPKEVHGILAQLCNILNEIMVQTKLLDDRLMFGTVDRRNNQLAGIITLHKMPEQQLVVFQKRKGDWIEFKRLYLIVVGIIGRGSQ